LVEEKRGIKTLIGYIFGETKNIYRSLGIEEFFAEISYI
jgi:hypothetical protein